jgi:hypothetical protein
LRLVQEMKRYYIQVKYNFIFGCKRLFLYSIMLSWFMKMQAQSVASFTVPDTVCVNQTFTITNTSTNASTYYWNFCSGNTSTTPQATNLGNPGGLLQLPSSVCIFNEAGNYYMFVANNQPETTKSLVRLNFGNTLSNIPTSINLGNPNNALPSGYINDIEIVNQNGHYYILVTGGYDGGSNGTTTASPRVVILDFGSSLLNTPTASNLGNLGNWSFPHSIETFQTGGNYYCFVLDNVGNTLSLMDFGNSLSNTPTNIILPNLNLINPGRISIVNYSDNWFGYITNGGANGNNTITVLDFGNSLLNNPTEFTPNISAPLNQPQGIYLFPECGELSGLVSTYPENHLLKLNFPNGPTGNIEITDMGSVANTDNANSISNGYRELDTLYVFVPQLYGNSISRLAYVSCDNSYIPSNELQTPPSISYNVPGVYNIALTTNESLYSRSKMCKQIVVVGTPSVAVIGSQTICNGNSAILTATGGSNYSWSPTAGLTATSGATVTATPTVTTTYTIIGSGNCGSDTAFSTVFVLQAPIVSVSSATVCPGASATLIATGADVYYWQPSTGLNKSKGDTVIANEVNNIINYTVTGINLGDELIYNGDFSSGNTGFTTDYTLSSSSFNGAYYVGPDYFGSVDFGPPDYNPVLDHTSTGDNMACSFDGATTESKLWSQSISNIEPNKNFEFSFWAIKQFAIAPIFELHFIGNITGDSILITDTVKIQTTPHDHFEWDEYAKLVWNSGANTNVIIQIVNLETNGYGNDVMIDDISLKKHLDCYSAGISTVTPSTLQFTTSSPATICMGTTTTITAIGANNYSWSPPTGLNTTTGATVTATPTVTTTYTVTEQNGCPNLIQTIPITVNQLPSSVIKPDIITTNNTQSPIIVFTGSNGLPPYTFYYTVNGGSTQTISTLADKDTVSLLVPSNSPTTYVYKTTSVADANGCSQNQEDSIVFKINSPLGIHETNNSALVTISPNPVHTQLNIVVTTPSHIKITELTGREVYTNELIAGASIIDVINLTSGVYFITIENDNSTITKKIIKY